MEQPRRKRQKVAVACDPCRNRKVKCDGRAPVCEPCEKRTGDHAVACTWNSDPGRSVPTAPTGHVRWLEDRIKALEDASSSHIQRQRPDPNASTNEPHNRVSLEDDTRQEAHASSADPGTQSRIQENSPHKDRMTHRANIAQASAAAPVQESPAGVDNTSPSDGHSVHAMVGASSDFDLREGFYGFSSAASFMQTVQKLVMRKLNDADISVQDHHGKTPLLISGETDTSRGQIECVLPTRRKADALMDLYWKYFHPLYPCLMKSQMQKDYEIIWTANASVAGERSFFCLLNIIFALASQIDPHVGIEHRAKTASVFYLRARELIDVVETGSVRLVQSFLLLGQYFQSTNEPHPCWLFVGLAIRTAQSLGLHSPETSDGIVDQSTREILRRVWHGCVLMDRILSMTYGRPPMLGPKGSGSVPFPTPMSDEYLILSPENQDLNSTDQPSSLDFYVQSLKLYEILHDVLFNFYRTAKQNNSQGPDVFDDYIGYSSKGQPSILELERRLLRWENNIPGYLRAGRVAAENDDGKMIMRQAVVLHQWALYVRLLLLRRVLSSLITTELQEIRSSTPAISSLSRRIFLQCSVVCVKVAQDAVSTVDIWKAPSITDIGFLSPWWYNVLFLYTSATVLIAARLNASISSEVSENSILASWSKAISLLETYGTYSLAVQKLTTTLRLLYEAVPQHYSRLKLPIAQTEQQETNSGTDQVPASELEPTWMTSGPLGVFHQPAWVQTFTQPDNTLMDMDGSFDPNDVSWLMTIPFDV